MTPRRCALVTGGAGFIGSHLARALLQRGVAVRVLDNLSVGRRENVPPGADFLFGDVLDTPMVEEALEGVDIVFHLAARVSIRSSVEGFLDDARTNTLGTVSLLQAAKRTRVRRILYASSMAVYADSPAPVPVPEGYATDPLSPYGIGKLASEKYCLLVAREMGREAVILRYFNTYGPGQTVTPYVGVMTIFINRLLRGEPPVIFGDGEQCRDFIYVEDVVQATLLASEAPVAGRIYNVGTGRATSVREIARLLIERLAPGCEPVYAPPHSGELRNCIADIERARAELGFVPTAPIEERLDEIIAWNATHAPGRH